MQTVQLGYLKGHASKKVWFQSKTHNFTDHALFKFFKGEGGVNLNLPHPNFAFFGCPNEVK